MAMLRKGKYPRGTKNLPTTTSGTKSLKNPMRTSHRTTIRGQKPANPLWKNPEMEIWKPGIPHLVTLKIPEISFWEVVAKTGTETHEDLRYNFLKILNVGWKDLQGPRRISKHFQKIQEDPKEPMRSKDPPRICELMNR